MSLQTLSPQQWSQYEQEGYLVLGQLLSPDELARMSERINQIMLGQANLDYNKVLMQLDSETGKYEDAGDQSPGFKGATLSYRKIQELEFDPLFLQFMQRPLFQHICEHEYGVGTPITCFRAMFMNKPARKGTFLPWHQDRWTFLDRDPVVTIWLALDPATIANGCVQVVPGSHKLGLINPEHHSGFITSDQVKEHCPTNRIKHLELPAGHAMLLHNWLLHASDVNKTDIPRRAFSVCYMDGRTRHSKGKQNYSTIFGPGALTIDNLQAALASR